MNRRDFLRLRTESVGRVAVLSCERLFMHYQHASVTMGRSGDGVSPTVAEFSDDEPTAVFDERTTQALFSEVGRQLRDADILRVVETEWLAVDGFRRDVEDLLATFRRRGGRVECGPHTSELDHRE